MGLTAWLLMGLGRCALRLRYRIKVTGIQAVAARGNRGILFLPNHPALIDPVIVLAHLHGKFGIRPLALEDQIDLPLIRKLAGCLGKTIVVCYLEKGQGNPETDPGIPKWEKQLISDSLLEACRLPNDIRDPQTGEIIRWDHYLALKGGRFPSSRR